MRAMFITAAALALAACGTSGTVGATSGGGETSSSSSSAGAGGVAGNAGAASTAAGTAGAGGDVITGSTSSETDTTETGSTCPCNCPEGPPAPCDPDAGLCPIDNYCADQEHDGKRCCRGLKEEPGICQSHECGQCLAKTEAGELTCCNISQGAADTQCWNVTGPGSTATLAAPGPGCEQLGLKALCSWAGAPEPYEVFCCPPS